MLFFFYNPVHVCTYPSGSMPRVMPHQVTIRAPKAQNAVRLKPLYELNPEGFCWYLRSRASR